MKQVVAALIVRENKILICQRTRHQTMPLKWEFPGGKIEPGEKPEQALQRELEEELGILATIGRKVATIRHDYRNPDATNSQQPNLHQRRAVDSSSSVELHFFLVDEFAGEIQNRIFKDVRWVSKREMADYDFLEADVALVNDLAEGKVGLT
jgi:8-oxo-dGTP diphosphatase